MSIKCKDIIKLPYTKDMKILAGHNGLDRPVSWVHIIYTPEVIDYFHGGELIFITNIKINNTNIMKDNLKKMAEKKLAGIVVTSHSSYEKIPVEIYNYANSLNFPIFALPNEKMSSDISQAICKFILLNHEKERSLNHLLESILFSYHESAKELNSRAVYHGYDLTKLSQVLILKADGIKSIIKDNITVEYIKRSMENSLVSILSNYGIKILSTQIDDSIVLLLMEVDKLKANNMDNALSLFYKETIKKFPEVTPIIGIGKSYDNLDYFKKSFKQAQIALKVARTLRRGDNYLKYEKIGVERLIFNVNDYEELDSFYTDMLGPLLYYDKLHSTRFAKTLDVYLSENNIGKASKKLHIHTNTLKYRLNRIQEILERDIKYPCNYISLKLAFFINGLVLEKKDEA